MSSWCLLLEWCDRRGGADGRRRTSGECDCEYDDGPAAEDKLTGERGGEKLIEAERARAEAGEAGTHMGQERRERRVGRVSATATARGRRNLQRES